MSVKERYFQLVAHGALVLLLFASIAFFSYYLIGFGDTHWYVYYQFYIGLALAHTWYILILLCINDFRTRVHGTYDGEKIAVILPCYNEDPNLLRRALFSVFEARGNKDIFVIDDGSTEAGVTRVIDYYAHNCGARVYRFTENKGKRAALHTAISTLISDQEFVVLIDSDTVLEKDALIRLIEPLKNPKVGAVSGQVKLLNETQNILTKMTDAYYYVALNVQRKAQSGLGMVSCCSGALAAYKSSIIRPMMGEFIAQEFLGRKCIFADDRHLTNLVLKQGYNVIYAPKALAYTHSPASLKPFLRQQLRWRRGQLQEGIYVLFHLWKTKPLLCIETLVWDFILPFLSFGLMLLVTLGMVFNPTMIPALLISLFFLVFVRNLPALLAEPKKIFGLMAFSIFSTFVMYWQSAQALLTLGNMKWITR